MEPGLSQVQNTGRAVFYGLETAFFLPVHHAITVEGTYTFLRRENLTDPGVFFTYIPTHHLTSTLRFTPFTGTHFILEGEYMSKRYSTSYGTIADPFALVHLSGTTSLTSQTRLEAGIRNLFDRDYALLEGYPEPGRTFFVTLFLQLER